MASLRRVNDDTPRAIREINPDVPEWLAAITDRLLEKNPDDRFQSAEDVCHLLDECLAHVQDPAVNQLPVSLAAQGAAKRKMSSVKPATSAPHRRWTVAAAWLIGILALATLSEATGVTNLAATVIRIAMNRGQLMIESSDPNIKIEVLQGGELVRIVEPRMGRSIDLTAGEYQIQLAGAAGGWSLSTDSFTLTRGGREIVKVRRQTSDVATDEEIVKVLRQAGDGPSGGGMMELLGQGRAQDATETERLGIYAIDVTTGEVVLVRDKPIGDLTYFGSPSWSNDGQRILFDVSPGKAFDKTRLKLFYVAEQKAVIKDLGLGNCPTLSPDGERVAFLLNPGVVPDAPSGIWLMRADGSERRHLGGYGVPKWSPDGKQLLIVSFSSPCRLSIMDVETAEQRPVQLAGHNFYSNPSWAGDGQTIVAVFSSGSDVGIALVDVTDPEQAQVKQILWRKGDRIDVSPLYPVYSPKTDLCVFVGGDENGEALYTVKPGQSDPPKRLEATRYDVKISRLSLSSDGRYVLFCNDRLNQLVEPGSTTGSELTEPE
jgi:WD40 repeat protein